VVPASEVHTGTVGDGGSGGSVRTSVLGVGAGRPTAAPPARVTTARPVFSRVAPPARPIPFEAKQEVLARTPGRPLDSQTEAEIRTRVERDATPASGRNANAPGQFGRPANQPTPSVNAAQPNPTPRPGGPQRPGISQQPQTEMNAPARNVPRPLQPGLPTGPASQPQPANAPRPVPRPPQIERTTTMESPRQPQRTPTRNGSNLRLRRPASGACAEHGPCNPHSPCNRHHRCDRHHRSNRLGAINLVGRRSHRLRLRHNHGVKLSNRTTHVQVRRGPSSCTGSQRRAAATGTSTPAAGRAQTAASAAAGRIPPVT